MNGPGNVEFPCGNMFLIGHDDDDGSISSIYQCFLGERHFILMTFYPHDDPVK